MPNNLNYSLTVSKKSIDMIIGFEVTSKSVYEKKYRRPVWPGGDSGVTIGIGYDLGYYTAKEINEAWSNVVNLQTLALMISCRGKKGEEAHALVNSEEIQQIDIPYEAAVKVFMESSLPAFAKQVKDIYPGVEKLPPDAQGALLSLVYNRGASLEGDRRKEMYFISQILRMMNEQKAEPGIIEAALKDIANQIRDMKRLWPGVKGLRDRRDKEADLVENATTDTPPEEIYAV